MVALVLLGVLLMAGAATWRRLAPKKKLKNWTPLWLELLGVGVIVAGLWRFPMARWVGLVAVVVMLLASGLRMLRDKKST